MNWDRWNFTLDDHPKPWAMDRRHVEMLEAAIRIGGFVSAVEIGLLHGRSTAAFVEAREAGAAIKRVLLCDICPTPELLKVGDAMRATGCDVVTFWRPSNELSDIDLQAELWVIDGDHSIEGVIRDLILAAKHGATAVAMHDTKHHQFNGPGLAAELARFLFPFHFEDAKKRESEETERGWFFGSLQPNPDLFQRLNELAL